MKVSKKEFLSLIKENITEMAMDFDPNMPERPHTDVQQKLATGDTPIKKVPLPKTGREQGEPAHNYQELLASQRYKQVIQKQTKYKTQKSRNFIYVLFVPVVLYLTYYLFGGSGSGQELSVDKYSDSIAQDVQSVKLLTDVYPQSVSSVNS